jgi:hypothetical protein
MGEIVKFLFWILLILVIVRGCMGSDENEVSDYDRGFEDGWMDVCEDIRQISPEFYRVLYDRKTC